MKELIKRALEKNQDAYSEIYELTYNKVAFTIRMLLKDDFAVDDILQETYITAFEKLATLKEPEKINAWICKIARNKTIDYLRKKKEIAFLNVPTENNQSNLEEIDLPEERVEFIPEKQMDTSENSRLLMDILNNLPNEQRICVIAFYYEQRSIKEIAEEVNCNEETVKSRIRYAKKKIKEQVEELKKTGTHLYGVAPIPFFVWLLKDAGESFRYSGGVTGIQVATSSMDSSFPENTATIETGKMSSAVTAKNIAQETAKVVLNGKKAGSLAMKLKALTVGQKIAVGLVSVGVTVGAIGGGVAGYQHLQANAIVEENTEEEAEVKIEDIEVTQVVEATETEEVETEELVIEYVSLLDQIDQLTPSDAVEVLRQYCENGTYGEQESLTVELENGAKKSSFCNEFGFLNAVLFSRGIISETSYYDAQSWREPGEELLELLEENNYLQGSSLDDVSEGSILVFNLKGADLAFYVNSVQDEVYELLYWNEGMLALEQDFPMDAMYRTAEQMEYMLSSYYTLYSYGKMDYSSVFWLELLEEGRVEENIAYIKCELCEKLVFDMKDYEELKTNGVVEQNEKYFYFIEEETPYGCWILMNDHYDEAYAEYGLEEEEPYWIAFDETDSEGRAAVMFTSGGGFIGKTIGESVIAFDLNGQASTEALTYYNPDNHPNIFSIREMLSAFVYDEYGARFDGEKLGIWYTGTNIVAPRFDEKGKVISFEIVYFP